MVTYFLFLLFALRFFWFWFFDSIRFFLYFFCLDDGKIEYIFFIFFGWFELSFSCRVEYGMV